MVGHNLALDLFISRVWDDLLRIQFRFHPVRPGRDNLTRQCRPNSGQSLQLIRARAVDVNEVGMRFRSCRGVCSSRMSRWILRGRNKHCHRWNQQVPEYSHTVDFTAA